MSTEFRRCSFDLPAQESTRTSGVRFDHAEFCLHATAYHLEVAEQRMCRTSHLTCFGRTTCRGDTFLTVV